MSTVKDNIRRLTEDGVRKSSVPTAPDYEPQAAAVRKTGAFTPPIANTTGGGSIASPLTEQSRVTSPTTIYDQTGTLAIDFNLATQITFTDANSESVVFNFSAP